MLLGFLVHTITIIINLVSNSCTGQKETDLEKLRSILAQLEYKYQIETWEKKGVPFKSHICVPENHPLTDVVFMEREDEGHVLKVTA